MTPMFAWALGWPELLVIGVVALLLFGRRLPEVGRSLGQGLVEFKRGLKDVGKDVDDVKSEAEQVKQDMHDAIASDDESRQT